MPDNSKPLKSLYSVILIIAVGFILKVASPVTLPLAISLFIFLLVNPLVNNLEKIRIPRWIAIVVAMLLLVVVFVLMIFFVTLLVNTLIEGLPRYSGRVTMIFGGVEEKIVDMLHLDTDIKLFEIWRLIGRVFYSIVSKQYQDPHSLLHLCRCLFSSLYYSCFLREHHSYQSFERHSRTGTA